MGFIVVSRTVKHVLRDRFGSFQRLSHKSHAGEREIHQTSPSNKDTQLEEVALRATFIAKDDNKNVKLLSEKLSAALLNVSLKDDLVKQHARVAEEAVAGWEKAENEVATLKEQLENTVQQKSALEAQVSHLDGALKECVRQLRLVREEQQQKINQAVIEKTHEWELIKSKLESQFLVLQAQVEASTASSPAFVDLEFHNKLEFLEKENAVLKEELLSQTKELEVRTIERDLSTKAAETASKQHLESIMKIAKLEAECRRLKAQSQKSPLVNEHKSTAASSSCVESLTDSQSDNVDQLNSSDMEIRKMNGMEPNEGDSHCSDSWATALMAELDRFKNEKVVVSRSLHGPSSDIDLMDDFLEMEQLVSFQQKKHGQCMVESEPGIDPPDVESLLRNELTAVIYQTVELEERIERLEAEKAELEIMLTQSQSCLERSQVQLIEAEKKLDQTQMELDEVNESKQHLQLQLNDTRVEAQTMSTKIQSLHGQMEKEQAFSEELATKCREFERELQQRKLELELHRTARSTKEMQIKQEGLAVAAGKLAECQKTIASLGNQLNSLASLEDFLIDTSSIPGLSGAALLTSRGGGEPWKLHLNDAFLLENGCHNLC
ncbi:hypothetical protein Ancab_037334 [Ancistrocladus abbreviatus]